MNDTYDTYAGLLGQDFGGLQTAHAAQVPPSGEEDFPPLGSDKEQKQRDVGKEKEKEKEKEKAKEKGRRNTHTNTTNTNATSISSPRAPNANPTTQTQIQQTSSPHPLTLTSAAGTSLTHRSAEYDLSKQFERLKIQGQHLGLARSPYFPRTREELVRHREERKGDLRGALETRIVWMEEVVGLKGRGLWTRVGGCMRVGDVCGRFKGRRRRVWGVFGGQGTIWRGWEGVGEMEGEEGDADGDGDGDGDEVGENNGDGVDEGDEDEDEEDEEEEEERAEWPTLGELKIAGRNGLPVPRLKCGKEVRFRGIDKIGFGMEELAEDPKEKAKEKENGSMKGKNGCRPKEKEVVIEEVVVEEGTGQMKWSEVDVENRAKCMEETTRKMMGEPWRWEMGGDKGQGQESVYA